MSELNQFVISKILGSKMKEIGPVGFGNFNLRSTTEEIQRALKDTSSEKEFPSFSYKEDAIVVRAFEAVRDGASTDKLLWDKEMAKAFVRKCRQLGLEAPDAYFIRRLIGVRKTPAKYKEYGIEISPTTKKEIHASIVPQYAHVIEFALVKLRYRYGVSIDDILLDPELGEKFESLANLIAPDLSSESLRLGALYIRKTRGIEKKELKKIEKLDLELVERAWKGAVTLAEVDPDEVPAEPGLIELKEENRYLYIVHNEDIQAAVSQLHTGEAFRLLANSFWEPRLEAITLHFVSGQKVEGVSIHKWERKLIHDREPVFNWPMPKKVA